MKYIVPIFLASLIYNTCCEQCSTIDFNVVWYRTKLDSPNYGRISDLANNAEVRILKIDPNQTVSIICENTIEYMENIYILKLNSSGIMEIRDSSFQNVPNLFDLDLSGNRIEQIRNQIFNGLNLSFLRLNNNRLEKIDSLAFNNMAKLKVIDLSHNKIKEINSEWFKNTNNIIHLILENDNIKTLGANTFKHLKHKEEGGTEDKLLNIHLGENEITSVHPQAFDGLAELNSVYLHENKIKTLQENTFSTLNRIKKVDLMYNEIECFSYNFKFILKIDEILLNGNPWNCTCLGNLKNWSDKNNAGVSLGLENLKCLIRDLESI